MIEARHHTRFKLQDELALVKKWDAKDPREYMAWRAQWTNFYEKMMKEERSNLDIYYALLKVLDGRALELVSTKYPNEESYSRAIKDLDEQFYNPTNLIRDMVDNLLNQQQMSDTYDSILSGFTKLNDAWRDLDRANLTKEQLQGLLFIAVTEKNLSPEGWHTWIEEQNSPKYRQNEKDAFNISAYFGAIRRAMLNLQKRKNVFGLQKPNKPTKSKKKQSTLYGSYNSAVGNNPPKAKNQQQAQGPKDTCVFCGQETHRYQLHCPKLRRGRLQLQSKDVYRIMQDAGIQCEMCLSPGHQTKNCQAMLDGYLKKCPIKEGNEECGKYHAKVLHEWKSEEPNEKAPSNQ